MVIVSPNAVAYANRNTSTPSATACAITAQVWVASGKQAWKRGRRFSSVRPSLELQCSCQLRAMPSFCLVPPVPPFHTPPLHGVHGG